jgi:Protein of unknown function (DUF1153)
MSSNCAVRVLPFRASSIHSERVRLAMDQFVQKQDNIIYLAGTDRSTSNEQCDLADDQLDPDLPPDNSKRWTPRRKAAVVLAIRNKVIGIWDACERYDLSAEELAEWERDLDQYGVPGLRTTRVGIYRKTSASK